MTPMYPRYSGYRPRVQRWHGNADMTVNYQNQIEAIKEWTDILGLSLTPTASYANNVNAGTATASYSFAGDANFLPSTASTP